MRTGSSTVTGIEKLLASGEEGLHFFEVFVPRYRTWTRADPGAGDVAALTAQYNQQRGIVAEALRVVASALEQELAGNVVDDIQTQQIALDGIAVRWNGSAGADNAAQYARQVKSHVDAEHGKLTGITQALSAAADQLETVVSTKVEAIRLDFATATVASLTGEQVDQLIAYARHDFGGTSDLGAQRDKVRGILSSIEDGDDPVRYSKQWLDDVFVPAVDTKLGAFTALNNAADTAVIETYGQLAEALEALGPSPYVSPDGRPSATTDLETAPSAMTVSQTLFSGSPSVLPAASTAAASTSPASTDTATVVGPTVATAADSERPEGAIPARPGQAAPVGSVAAPAAVGKGENKEQAGQGLDDTAEGAGDDAGETGPDQPAEIPTVPAESTEMGKVGEWRPGDIANVLTAASQITGSVPDVLAQLGAPLQAVGTTAESFGNAFKSVVGEGGVTGLIAEGVDAAERLDKLADHHTQPSDTPVDDQGSGLNEPVDPTGTDQEDTGRKESDNGDFESSESGNDQAAATTESSENGNVHAATPHGHSDGQAISNRQQGPSQTENVTQAPISAAATSSGHSAMPGGGFLGHPMASRASSDSESEHTPKIRYVRPSGEGLETVDPVADEDTDVSK